MPLLVFLKSVMLFEGFCVAFSCVRMPYTSNWIWLVLSVWALLSYSLCQISTLPTFSSFCLQYHPSVIFVGVHLTDFFKFILYDWVSTVGGSADSVFFLFLHQPVLIVLTSSSKLHIISSFICIMSFVSSFLMSSQLTLFHLDPVYFWVFGPRTKYIHNGPV